MSIERGVYQNFEEKNCILFEKGTPQYKTQNLAKFSSKFRITNYLARALYRRLQSPKY
jgi:hypothetical protein